MNTNAPTDVVHFSTDALPEKDRMAMWREVFGRHIVNVDFEPIPNAQFFHTAALRSLPGLSLVTSICAGFRALRTRQQVAGGGDDLVLTVNTEGTAHMSQLGRETALAPYEGVLLSATEVATVQYPTRARFVAFRIPRETIAPAANDMQELLARRLPRTEVLRLLPSYAAALDDQTVTSHPLRQTIATHITDLVVLAIGTSREAAEVARGRGLRAARLKAIKDDILAHIADERLSVTDIASRQHVTPRYVQLLFEGDGKTFSDYLVEQRLVRAYCMLTQAKFPDWTISAIAFEVGFSNLSYFNRTFRRRYGATPSDVREQARRNGGW